MRVNPCGLDVLVGMRMVLGGEGMVGGVCYRRFTMFPVRALS